MLQIMRLFAVSTTNFKCLFHVVPFDPLAWGSLLDYESTTFTVRISIVELSGTTELVAEKIH